MGWALGRRAVKIAYAFGRRCSRRSRRCRYLVRAQPQRTPPPSSCAPRLAPTHAREYGRYSRQQRLLYSTFTKGRSEKKSSPQDTIAQELRTKRQPGGASRHSPSRRSCAARSPEYERDPPHRYVDFPRRCGWKDLPIEFFILASLSTGRFGAMASTYPPHIGSIQRTKRGLGVVGPSKDQWRDTRKAPTLRVAVPNA